MKEFLYFLYSPVHLEFLPFDFQEHVHRFIYLFAGLVIEM